MKKVFTPTLIVAGLMTAGVAAAETPYGAWDAARVTQVEIVESFNPTSVYTEDNSSREQTNLDLDVDYDNTEQYDYSVREDNRQDNSVRKDFDYASHYETHSQHAEDNSVRERTDVDFDIDFQVATPTLTSTKKQKQHAGHQADQTVLGAARGHEVDVTGGPTIVSAGNDEQSFYGPAMVNTNINQLPQNQLFIEGSNVGPISQANTFAGRDMGPKGVFAPVGNTSAFVSGDTSQSSGAQLGQSGDASNSIADQMRAPISR